jgi:hypothetical protein
MTDGTQKDRAFTMPEWNVITSKGKIVGTVYGSSERDALTSVEQTPAFDKYHALTVRQIIRCRASIEAQAGGYGSQSYWDYLDQKARDDYAYFMAKGDKAKAERMLTESLSEALAGNDGI